MTEIGLDALGVATGLVCVLLIAKWLRFRTFIESFNLTIRKSLRVITSSRISDHWKEQVVPRYAIDLFINSLHFIIFFGLMVLAFAGGFILIWMPFNGWNDSVKNLFSWQVQFIACVLGIGFFALPHRHLGRTENNYKPLERFLHQIALSQSVRRTAFDIDCLMENCLVAPIDRPVYITGLARSGTTLLLEALYSTGDFLSLTYRDMPFITAPKLWSRLSIIYRRREQKRERAHGDGMQVGSDSPEAFEEIFWLTMLDSSYVKSDGLMPHTVDAETITQYRRYVFNILAASSVSTPRRYLCKNNNHTLRIATLKQAFPEALILVPFRNPLDHARSFLRQHQRFVVIHRQDAFSLRYMNWLGHFEFGLNMKPFLLNQDARPSNFDESNCLAYWVRYWAGVYGYLLAYHRSDVLFFDYDRFVQDPKSSLERLGEVILIDQAKLGKFEKHVKPRLKSVREPDVLQNELLELAIRLHTELRAQSV